MATMMFARRVDHDDKSRSRTAPSASSTSSRELHDAQMEALKRYRTGCGEQRMTVQHVNVSEGQAEFRG